LLAAVFAFVACEDDLSGTGNNNAFVAVTGITVPTTGTVGTLSLATTTVQPTNATNKTIKWSLEDPGPANASLSGSTLFTTAAGTVKVKATIANGKAPGTDYTKDITITITITTGTSAFVKVEGIDNVPKYGAINISFSLKGDVSPESASNKTIKWTIADKGVTNATLSGSTLTATMTGTVKVKATITNGTAPGTDYTKDFDINITEFIPVTSITNVPTTSTVEKSPLTLTATVNPYHASNQRITWTVKDKGTTGATISRGNKLTTKAAGTVTVTATIAKGKDKGTADYTQDFDITINSNLSAFVAVTTITGVPTTGTVGTLSLATATVQPTNATNKTIIWTVKESGTTGAAIHESGDKLTTTAAGTVTVTATIANGKAPGTDYTEDFKITIN
jgi:endo-1,4-beta-xylanase